MSKPDILDVIEYMTLLELQECGLLTDKKLEKRFEFLDKIISQQDVIEVNKSWAKDWAENTGFLRVQKCTNKDCGYTFRSEDISETCDICYHPTIRIINDIS